MIRHATTVAAVTAVLSTVALGAPAASAPPAASTRAAEPVATPADRADDLLARARHGERALNALGGDLDVAAARNAMSPGELRSLLRSDRAAWVGSNGQVFYIDPPATGADRARAAAAPFPYGDTFLLHSRPGASRVVYLDFDGGAVSGTFWNDDFGVVTTAQPPYDTDRATTFGTAERDAIQSVWQRVSEDFAPFDVDVTTQDPGAAALARTSLDDAAYGTRALITPSVEAQSKICTQGCGGVATVATYNRVGNAYAEPAWIFSHQLGNGTKAIAEAATHEVGHNLGLEHDGLTDGPDYFGGHGSWAPIMGVGYSKPITQWSRGEYTDANNPQNDLAVIQDHGLALRPDEHGDTAETATPLEGDGVTAAALIGLRTDVDVFRLSRTCTGPLAADATPAPTSPNLDIGLRLLSSTGVPIATANPASGTLSTDRASGLAAGLSLTTEPGSYYLEVDGVGAGRPASTGYSDYASLGTYSLRVSGCNGAAPAGRPGAPRVGVASPGATTDARITATARWRPPLTDGGSAVTGYRVTALRLAAGGAVVGTTVSAVQRPGLRTLTMVLPRRSRYAFTVRAINAIGQSRPSARSAPVAGR